MNQSLLEIGTLAGLVAFVLILLLIESTRLPALDHVASMESCFSAEASGQ